ncbi:MAG: IS30 family transposase, partial [Patescibacteria group bacterium]
MKKKRKKRQSFNHFTQEDRDRMEVLLNKGHTQKETADIIGKSESAVSRERKRRKKRARKYRATIAQQKANSKRASSKYYGMAVESNLERKKFIIGELQKFRSPDEIAGRMEVEKKYKAIGKDAIYSWLYFTRGNQYAKHLCTMRHKKKPQKKTARRQMIQDRISLKERPKRGIHAQGDAFVSPKDGGTSSGIMVVISDTQLLLGTKTPTLSPKDYTPRIDALLKQTNADDCTFDNGIENKNHKQLSVPAYFCDPHAPWQKPDVENNIGLLRKWFVPKPTHLKYMSERDLQGYLGSYAISVVDSGGRRFHP